jgi:hypothetical protein
VQLEQSIALWVLPRWGAGCGVFLCEELWHMVFVWHVWGLWGRAQRQKPPLGCVRII